MTRKRESYNEGIGHWFSDVLDGQAGSLMLHWVRLYPYSSLSQLYINHKQVVLLIYWVQCFAMDLNLLVLELNSLTFETPNYYFILIVCGLVYTVIANSSLLSHECLGLTAAICNTP